MRNGKTPKIAVLLAAFNGEKYIKQQIESILNQYGIIIDIYISIDQSTDKTLEICQSLKENNKNIFIISSGEIIFGSAGKNFYHLIERVDIKKYDYISLADQDDIWKKNKIYRGITVIESKKISGYSSDVECFWDDNRKSNKIIKKSYPQKKFDYYFEPAGPGCTYILNKDFALAIQNKIKENKNLPFHHDWYIYAFARVNNFKWHIDNQPNIYYRQHSKNQVGANHGINQYIKRFKKLRSGNFKKDYKEILRSIDRKNISKIKILLNPFEYRRNTKEAILLFIFCLVGWI